MTKVHPKNSQKLYEANYRKLVSLLPDVEVFNHVTLGSENHAVSLTIDVLERTPYTVLLDIKSGLSQASEYLPGTRLQVRMYHDAGVAEVIMVQGKRNINSHYDYPNDDMHLPDEKRQGNRLLAEMLHFCQRNDYKKSYFPQQIEINS
ncbi:MAG: DUF1249 domain-containing protein [Gammaproteobacteria bacterium]|nr:DUF1249 domain-containing protein [Gammaproteobacteria bacterium]